MRQSDLGSATVAISGHFGKGSSEALAGSDLIEASIAPRDRAALAALLPEFRIVPRVLVGEASRVSAIVTWPHSHRWGQATRRAAAFGVPLVVLGPGVLRAPPVWEAGAARMLTATAHVMSGPSTRADILDPGRLLLTRGWETKELLARAANLRRDIVSRRLGGRWWNAGTNPGLPRRAGYLLVVAGEEPGIGGNAAPARSVLGAMLEVAFAEVPPEEIVILAADARKNRDPLRRFLREAAERGCIVITDVADPWEAVERAGCVYVAGGETGFLALLAGAKIRCFADSFYSGWGTTTDEATVPQKPFRRTSDEIFAGSCLLATRYLDPYRLKSSSFEDTLDIIAAWRNVEAANRRIAVCVGMSFWKRRQIAAFLRSSSGIPAFRRTTDGALARAYARPEASIAAWASRIPAGLAEAAAARGIPLVRVEDGFIRSVGLGSNFMPPASIVLDRHGMYFDPSARSGLERLLAETEYDEALVARARGLIAQLVTRGVTKYNLGTTASLVEWPAGKRRILVPGQVEDDLSVRLGGDGINGNLDLLGRVRAANPDAFILYKPHPDVEAGHRKGRIPDEIARGFANRVVRDVSTAALLAEIDEVHTLTSLAGFEALLRGRRVVVYGRPFYGGWGLTTDLAKTDRGRQLAIEELVAGALILYPRYLDPVTRLPCGPEVIIERLDDPELWRPGLLVLARRMQGILARQWNELAGKVVSPVVRSLHTFGRNGPGTPQL